MSESIKFTLDGNEVTAAPGETIWDVAKREGTVIPHLCHKDQTGYRPDGNCRACVVEVEGERVLAASCCRNPANGMVVKTDTDRAKKSREMVMELLLADQPEQATAHDKSAHLWDMAEANGVSTSRFPKTVEKERIPLLDDSHVAMRVNLDACISCGLCVRACREVQVNDVIGMAGRGHDAYPVFDMADPMGQSTCVACGECVQACPTGALMPATVVDAAQVGDRADFDSETTSICPFCGVGCQVSLKVKDGKVKYVEGINGPANEGRLCVKGRFGFDYIHHPHRLTKPLIRREDAPAKGLNVDPGKLVGPISAKQAGTRRWISPQDGMKALPKRPAAAPCRGLRFGQVLERRGLSLPEVHPSGLWPQQRRPLHAALPCLLGGGASGKRRLRCRHCDLQRDPERRCRHRHRLQPDRRTIRSPRPISSSSPSAAAS